MMFFDPEVVHCVYRTTVPAASVRSRSASVRQWHGSLSSTPRLLGKLIVALTCRKSSNCSIL